VRAESIRDGRISDRGGKVGEREGAGKGGTGVEWTPPSLGGNRLNTLVLRHMQTEFQRSASRRLVYYKLKT